MGLRFQISKILRNSYFAGHVNYDNIAAAADGIVTVVNLTNASLTVAAQPDVPRNMVITIVDTTNSIVAGTITITGIGAYGQTLVETFDCSTGDTVDSGVFTGNKAFATVASVVASGFSVLGGAGDETVKVATGNKIGLPCYKLKDVYKACVDGADETIGTHNLTYGTITPNTAANGTRDYDFWFTYYPVPEVY